MLNIILCLLAGATLPFAFAPFNVYVLAFISPAVLFFLWARSKPLTALWQGLCFGLAFFAIGSSWIFISIHRFGNAPTWLAILITGLFILILASYYALQGLLNAWFFKHQPTWAKLLLAYPMMWIAFEWLRGYLFTGFPWLYLGYSQLFTPLRGFAPLAGIFAVSFFTAYIACCLALLAYRTGYTAKLFAVGIIVSSVLVGFGLSHIQWTQQSHSPITVSLVQGNIPQRMKWQAKDIYQSLATYQTLSQPHWQSNIIIWPEAAIPALPEQVAEFVRAMNQQARQHHSYFMYGAPAYAPTTRQYFNALFLGGAGSGYYYKRHLVPFGEYTPLASLFKRLLSDLHIPMSDLSPGPQQQPLLLLGKLKVAPFICYEIAYPHEVRKYSQGSQLIVSITDDSWFGDSIARNQHLQIAQMRALENGRYIILASNSGLTATINPQGEITAIIPPDKAMVLTTTVYATTGNTPYGKQGSWLLWLIGCLLLSSAWLWRTP